MEKRPTEIHFLWCQNEVKVCEMRIILVTLENLLERKKKTEKSRKLAKCVVVSLFILMLLLLPIQQNYYTSERGVHLCGKSFAKSAVSV